MASINHPKHELIIGQLFPKQAVIANAKDVVFAFASPLVNITWTGAGTSYKVAWRLRDDLNWTDIPEVTAPAASISNTWTLGKLYEFKITSLANGKETLPDVFGFTIPSGAPAPTAATVVRVGLTGAKITWTGDPADTYMVAGAEIGTPFEDYVIGLTQGNELSIGKNTPTDTFSIGNGLDPDKHYDFRLFKIVNDEQIPYIDSLLQI